MERTGRKNAAGSRLRWEMLKRIFSVRMLEMAAIGFGIGFTLRGLSVLGALDGTIATWGRRSPTRSFGTVLAPRDLRSARACRPRDGRLTLVVS